jgi:hypothetical protein
MSNQPTAKPEPDWVTVYTTPSFSEAHLMAGHLRSEGIEPYVHAQPGASAIGITLGTFGGISVLVRPSDYDRAMDVLFPETPDELPDDPGDYIVLEPEEDDEPDANGD